MRILYNNVFDNASLLTSSRGWISRRYRTPSEYKFWERRRKNSKSILLSQSALRTSKHNKLGPFCDQIHFWPKKGIVLGHFYQKMAKNGTKIHFSQKELDRIFCPFGISNLNVLPTFWRTAYSLSPISINVGPDRRQKSLWVGKDWLHTVVKF